MALFAFSGWIIGISSLAFGIFVLRSSTARPIARAWFFFTLSVAIWGFGTVIIANARSPEAALQAWRWTYAAGVIWIPTFFYHFVCQFLQLRRPRFIAINYALSVLSLALIPQPSFFLRVTWSFNEYYAIRVGPLYPLFLFWWFGVVAASHFEALRVLRSASEEQGNRIRYFLWATGLGFIGGALTYPAKFGILLHPGWGALMVPLYPAIMSYAIVRHRLLDVSVVIRKTLLYSLVSTVLASVYIGIIAFLAYALGKHRGSAPFVSSALAAIFITLLFNPLRVRTQRLIDRRFPRERLDPDLLQEAAGSFAHEMKRPLAKISLPAELALQDLGYVEAGDKNFQEVLPALKQRLRLIINQSIDAGYLIEAIRSLSTSPSAPPEVVDLSQVLKEALRAEEDLLERRNVTVDLILPKDSNPITGRARQLEIVFVNLIKNAAEAMNDLPAGQSKKLKIEVRDEMAGVAIHVKDSGPGITSEYKEKIFQPTFTTKGANGTGMGLYLSRQILEAHGGSLDVINGGGAEFIVRLPRR